MAFGSNTINFNELQSFGTVGRNTGVGNMKHRGITVSNVAGSNASPLQLVRSPANVQVINTQGSAFTWNGTLLSPLAPGTSDNFAISFSTATAGTFQAQVRVWHNDPTKTNPHLFRVRVSVQ